MSTFTDHAIEAARYLQRAEEIANRDGHFEHREPLVERFLRYAEVHAQLATAQRLGEIQGRLAELGAISDILETKVYPALAEGV